MSLTQPTSAHSPLATPAAAMRRGRESRLWLSPRGVAILVVITLLLRWLFSAIRQLVPDEAYYWVWSRHLAMSYPDHPPMIAYLIRLGTAAAGHRELGVRWPMGLLAVGMVAILAVVFGRLCRDGRAASFVAVSLLLSPMIAVLGSIATPDTPACFFQAAALACALLIFAPGGASLRRGWLWLGFGLLCGLALDSKYTSVLLGVAVLLALLWSAEGRRHLRTPWPWLGALAAAAAFSPVILWNAHHQWESFRFQLQHGLNNDDEFSPWASAINLGDYVGSQFMVATPVLFCLAVAVLAVYWRRRGLPMHQRILLLTGTLPLVFFAAAAIHKKSNGNWPIFAYLPTTLLIGHYLAEKPEGQRQFWAEVAVKVALIGLIVIHLPEALMWMTPRLGNPQWDRLFGWKELAQKVESLRGGSAVFAGDYEYASELSFYMPNHPLIWPLPNNRPTLFDDLPGQVGLQAFNRVLIVRRRHEEDAPDVVRRWLEPAFTHVQTIDFDQTKLGRVIRKNAITLASQ